MKFARLAVAEAVTVLMLAACGGSSSTDETPADAASITLSEAEQLSQTERVRLRGGDSTAPALTVTSQGSVSLAGAVSLAGTITDNQLIYRVSWSNNRGGSGRAVLSGSTRQATWAIGSIQLQSGSNVITLTAEDVAGNTSAIAVTVNRDGSAAPAPSPVPAPAPSTAAWQQVASEGSMFALSKTETVRYGADGSFTERTLPASQWACDNSTFGDPAFGRAKVCQVAMAATSAPAPAATPAPAPAATPAPAPAPAPAPTPAPAPAPTSGSSSTTTVNAALVPGRLNAGWAERRIATTGEQPGPDAGGIGAARTVCSPSHFNFDDALVYPGQPGRAHLHVYFGNTGADANSTPSSILNSGNSTCRGGIVNRSAYWAPAIIDTATGRPVVPDQENFVYYKTGYFGILDRNVRATPAGFRMIAGDSKSQVAQPRVAEYTCLGVSEGRSTLHSCPPGTQMRMAVTFPQCWDGVNLSSPDHRSHVAYPTEGRGCIDPRYPVPIFEISLQFNYTVPAGGNANWRLSSDINGTPAGSSTHGDWMNGWEQDIMQTWVTRVINPGFSASGGLGDGRALY